MNQILSTPVKKEKKFNRNFFKFQFTISILIMFSLLFVTINSFLSLYKKEHLSANLINNYNVYQLYANNFQDSLESNDTTENDLFGIIEIPSINIYYPIFSHLNEELLKISPCKFFGSSPKENGNICIAGHNYNNSMFFSNLYLLKNDDEIYIYDHSGYKYVYKVFNFYEVNESDLSPIFNYNSSSKELTLITCNNLNLNRLIVKAYQVN